MGPDAAAIQKLAALDEPSFSALLALPLPVLDGTIPTHNTLPPSVISALNTLLLDATREAISTQVCVAQLSDALGAERAARIASALTERAAALKDTLAACSDGGVPRIVDVRWERSAIVSSAVRAPFLTR